MKSKSPTISQYSDKNEYQRQWCKLNPEKTKEYYLRRDKEIMREKAWLRRYNMTRLQYDELFKKQNGCCAICETKEIGRGFTYFCVDHDHNTGKIRGLLCDLCNRGLGYFRDNPLFFKKAGEYLENN